MSWVPTPAAARRFLPVAEGTAERLAIVSIPKGYPFLRSVSRDPHPRCFAAVLGHADAQHFHRRSRTIVAVGVGLADGDHYVHSRGDLAEHRMLRLSWCEVVQEVV